MIWLTAQYALIAGAIAIPALLILYFLKLRRRDVEISTTLLWKKAIQDLQANAPFQRLRRNILLILQLLALGAILAALGQPQIKSQTITGQRHVIMLDRSASMMSLDEKDDKGGAAARLDEAKKQARALVASMREGGLFDTEKDAADQAMVIAFDTQAEVVQQMTSDKAALERAIDSVTATESPTRIEEAIRLAKAQQRKRVVEGQEVEGLTADEPFTMHIFSDGRIGDASKASPGPEDVVEFHRVGQGDSSNAAVVGLRAERSFENPSRLSVYVSLQNNQAQVRAVDVELLLNGVGAGIRSTTIPGASAEGIGLGAAAAARAGAEERAAAAAAGVAPTETASAAVPRMTPGVGGVVFSLERGEGAVVQVRLRSPSDGGPLEGDALDVDNRAFLVVPPARKLAVAVVSARGNLFLASALEGLPLSRLVTLSPAQFEQRVREGTTGEFDVVVLDGWLPKGTGLASAPAPAPATSTPATDAPAPVAQPASGADVVAQAGEVLPPGRYLILAEVPMKLGALGGGARVVGPATGCSIIDWSRDHPVLRGLSLDGLLVAKCPKLAIQSGGVATTIATSDIGPLMLEVATPDTRAIVVPFDVAESNWPFNVSFVVFMASATTYLGDDGGTGAAGRSVQPGSVLSDRLPAGASDIEVKTAAGETQKLLAGADGRIIFGPLNRSGVYEVSWKGAAGPTDANIDDRAVRYYASNLLDPEESDLASVEVVSLASTEAAAATKGSAIADRKLWPWLLLGCLAIVMLEWFVYNKKVHV
ncbi:MAG: BatA and WFA domain-containing protein [Phycisphaerales bacterium]|nr:BatA and WFA domain-containing protein [Phycisphaerales bacterium]